MRISLSTPVRNPARAGVLFAVLLLTASARLGAQSVVDATVDLRLGGFDAPEHLAFVRPPALLATPAGELLVLDRTEATVLVLGPDGELRRQLGSRGEGPGEFTAPRSFGIIGDTVWVADFPLPRVSFFRMDGSHYRTDPLENVDLGHRVSAPVGPTGFHEGGFVSVVPQALPVGAAGRVDLPLLSGPRDGPLKTIGHVVQPKGLTVAGVGHFAYAPVPISPLVSEDRYGRGWVVAAWPESRPESIEIHRFRADGSTAWDTELTIPPVRVDREAAIRGGLDIAADIIDGAIRRGEASGSPRDLVEAGLYLPEDAAAVRRMFMDVDGRIWLEVAGDPGALTWWVLEADGSPGPRVRVPAGVELLTGSDRQAWGVARGEFDEVYLVRVRF